MNILITGGTGYIGSNLGRKLVDEGDNVIFLIRKSSSLKYIEDIKSKVNIIYYEDNVENLAARLSENKIEIVYHLASLYITEHKSNEVEALINSNILFGAKLLEAMKIANVKKLINTGTSWQHYNGEEYNPTNLYAATKEAFEDIIRYYNEGCGLKSITLEIYDTYGLGDKRGKLLNKLKELSNTGEALDMSKGEQAIDLVYLEDVLQAFTTAGKALEGNIKNERYGVYSGRSISIKELVEQYQNLSGKKININFGGREYRKREVMSPNYNLKKLINWECKITLEEGLLKFINEKTTK